MTDWRKFVILPFLLIASQSCAQQESFGISVDVNLVVLHASVHDRRGQDVLNLRQQDFALYEDGVRQTIQVFRREDIPVTVGLIVDHSGSMRAKLTDVTAAAQSFARSSNPKDEIFVVNFNEKVFSGLGANRFTDRPLDLEIAIAKAPADGQTALYDAVTAGLQQLDAGHWDKKVLVVISDGGDNASTHTLAAVSALAERTGALIYAVGLFTENDPDANPRVLKQLAEATGGEAYFPQHISEVTDICDHIAEDIRNQYTIGYVSTNVKTDGAHRAVRLAAATPGLGKLRVRTRSGYIAQGGPK
jgi:VWFA-related protein